MKIVQADIKNSTGDEADNGSHLEMAKIPPFIEPKQESATKIGTAMEKFP